MPLTSAALPLPTPIDPSEDPPSSIDPLGTLTFAERLADLLLPGMTARMWKVRLLTFATVAAAVAERALRRLGGRADARLEARLAFERLFVSAAVRWARKDSDQYRSAAKRLPGSSLARAALASDDEPLTRHNFLKGQAVNGAYGVMARLALNLGLVDEDGRLGRNGPKLLLAWAEGQHLPGILDDENRATLPGAKWIEEAAKRTAISITEGKWPKGDAFWRSLIDRLRLDRLGPAESRVLVELLYEDPVRKRVMDLLRQGVDIFRKFVPQGRGMVEREVLALAIHSHLKEDRVDRLIGGIGFVAPIYEMASGWLQQGLDAVLWGLKHLGGSASPGKLLAQTPTRMSLEDAREALRNESPAMDKALERLQETPKLDLSLTGPLVRLRDDILTGLDSPEAFLETLMARHERVQREKRKRAWIDRNSHWILQPGFGIDGDQPPVHGHAFLHPFRIHNAYALLAGLGEVDLETHDGEE